MYSFVVLTGEVVVSSEDKPGNAVCRRLRVGEVENMFYLINGGGG